jgi:hypothetical protein
VTDLTKLSDAELLTLAKGFLGAKIPAAADPLALDQQQLHALSGSVLEGLPIVGPSVREGAQKLGAKWDTTIEGTTYEDALKRRQGAFDKSVQQNPATSVAGNVAGGVAGMLPFVGAFPAAFGAGSGSILGRTAASTVSGGILGGADAAARSGGDMEKTGLGAGIGAGLGFVAPATGQAVGRGLAAGLDKMMGLSKPGGAASDLSRPAAQYALDSFTPANVTNMRRELGELGPQAMLADVSPEWMGIARGGASRPGARDAIVNPLLARNETKNARLGADINSSLGPAPVPSQIDEGITAGQNALAPEYQRVLQNARAVNTEPLANRLDGIAANLRGPEARAVREVRTMLDIPGAPGNLDPHPRALLSTRQAIDGLLSNEANPSVTRQLTLARREVDAELARAAPGIKDVDAYYQELARQREGLGLGGSVLDSGKTAPRPQELAQAFQQGAIPEGNLVGPSATPRRIQQGARAEIDRVVGQNANDPAAMQRLVKSEGDWNRDKLRTLFGNDRADQALGAIDRETRFAQTGNRVTAGSDTAMANRFGNFLDETAKPPTVPLGMGVTGAVVGGAQRGLRKILGNDGDRTAARFADELGRVAVAQGGERDALINSLLDAATRRQSLEPLSAGTRELMAALLRAGPIAENQQLKGR